MRTGKRTTISRSDKRGTPKGRGPWGCFCNVRGTCVKKSATVIRHEVLVVSVILIHVVQVDNDGFDSGVYTCLNSVQSGISQSSCKSRVPCRNRCAPVVARTVLSLAAQQTLDIGGKIFVNSRCYGNNSGIIGTLLCRLSDSGSNRLEAFCYSFADLRLGNCLLYTSDAADE